MLGGQYTNLREQAPLSGRPGKGDVLLSIEAMKMESLVCAEREGTVTHIHVKHGDTVPAKALVVEMVERQ